MAASVEELVFDLSLDSLFQQRDVLKDVRARSATLLTASSIVTSFLGGRAIDAVGLTAVTDAATAAFLLTLMPAIYLSSTTNETRLLIEGTQLYSELASAEASLGETYMALADEIDAVRLENRLVVGRTLRTLRLGFAALLAEVILLLTTLAVH